MPRMLHVMCASETYAVLRGERNKGKLSQFVNVSLLQ